MLIPSPSCRYLSGKPKTLQLTARRAPFTFTHSPCSSRACIVNAGRIDFGYVNVNKQPKLYKKIRGRTFENIGYGPITIEPFEYDTMGFSLIPDRNWQEAMAAEDKRFIGAAIYGLSYILKRTAPNICMGYISDINTDVSLTPDTGEEWKSALYLYDTVEGGGYAEKVCDQFSHVLELCR